MARAKTGRAGMAVPSRVPGSGPTDASGKVAAHQGVNDQPTTAGGNPNPPGKQMTSGPETLTSSTPVNPGSYSQTC